MYCIHCQGKWYHCHHTVSVTVLILHGREPVLLSVLWCFNTGGTGGRAFGLKQDRVWAVTALPVISKKKNNVAGYIDL